LAIGDQNGARHDFRHPFRKLENVVPDPVGRDLVGGKRFIRAIEHPDADEHIRPTLEQKIFPKSWLLAQQRHKTLLHEARNLAGGAACQREFSDDCEHVPAPGQARAGDAQGSCSPSGGMRESLIAQDAIQALAGKALRPGLRRNVLTFPSSASSQRTVAPSADGDKAPADHPAWVVPITAILTRLKRHRIVVDLLRLSTT
jgi:hypothetical protein